MTKLLIRRKSVRLLAASACAFVMMPLAGCTEAARTQGLQSGLGAEGPTPNVYTPDALHAWGTQIQLASSATLDAFRALGRCPPSYYYSSNLRSSQGKDFMTFWQDDLGALNDEWDHAYQAWQVGRTVTMSQSFPDLLRRTEVVLADAKKFTIDCGVLTPELLAEPGGDTTWWDYSSGGSGGYTPPGSTPPPPPPR